MEDDPTPADEPETPWPVALREGFVRPSAPSLLLAVGLALAGFAGLTVGIDEDFVASPSHWVLASEPADLGLDASSTLLRLEREAADTRRVVLLGSSIIRMAVDAPRLEEALAGHLGGPVPVANLTAGGQSLTESLALAERVAGATKGIVVVGVGPGSLANDDGWASKAAVSARYAIRSDVIDDAARRAGATPPAHVGNYFWDNRAFLIPRVPYLARNLLLGPPEIDVMPTRGRPAPKPREWKARTRRRAKRMGFYPERRDRNLGALERIVELVAATDGLELAVLSCPRNDRFVEERELDPVYDDFAERIAAFAQLHGVTLLEVDAAAGLTPEDFLDGTHMRSADAIDRYTGCVAERIAGLLAGTERPR